MHFSDIIPIAKKKALKSECRYKVSAIGVNAKGEVIASCTNRRRFSKLGGSIHAEMQVMKTAPKSLSTIILCRVGKRGLLRPIDPCIVCSTKAKELGVKILPIRP